GQRDVEPALRLVRRQKQAYLTRMQRLAQRKSELSKRSARRRLPVTELLIDAALLHAEADVRWLGHAEQELRAAAQRRLRARGSFVIPALAFSRRGKGPTGR